MKYPVVPQVLFMAKIKDIWVYSQKKKIIWAATLARLLNGVTDIWSSRPYFIVWNLLIIFLFQTTLVMDTKEQQEKYRHNIDWLIYSFPTSYQVI